MLTIKGFTEAKKLMERSKFTGVAISLQATKQIKNIFGKDLSAKEVVEHIVLDVQEKGDSAVSYYTTRIDGITLNTIKVSEEEIEEAYNSVDRELVAALELAARRIEDFHIAYKPEIGISFANKIAGRMVRPLNRVGLYIPGGTAAYPSTVLMTAIPAKVAGVNEVIIVSPPNIGGDIHACTLAAAKIAKVNNVFKIGGAQAIAALAFGTELVPKVDKICGPGNIFVTLAKKMVYGAVDIDGLEGPSEIVIVADETASPILCAADLLAQAEHDPLASVILITTSAELANQVEREIVKQLKKLERQVIAEQAIEKGAIISVGDISEAIKLVNIYAPEHVSLMVADAVTIIPEIQNAGCIFIGDNSPVALGDYIAGPSHVLPTGGNARFSSPLGVDDFLKVTDIINSDKNNVQELGKAAMVIARYEGFDAHAKAIGLRLN
jgi:histidinol dehydrogenase